MPSGQENTAKRGAIYAGNMALWLAGGLIRSWSQIQGHGVEQPVDDQIIVPAGKRDGPARRCRHHAVEPVRSGAIQQGQAVSSVGAGVFDLHDEQFASRVALVKQAGEAAKMLRGLVVPARLQVEQHLPAAGGEHALEALDTPHQIGMSLRLQRVGMVEHRDDAMAFLVERMVAEIKVGAHALVRWNRRIEISVEKIDEVILQAIRHHAERREYPIERAGISLQAEGFQELAGGAMGADGDDMGHGRFGGEGRQQGGGVDPIGMAVLRADDELTDLGYNRFK